MEESKKERERVSCEICGKVVLKASLTRHIQQIHDKSNKLTCHLCQKVLSSGPWLKAHIETVHEGLLKYVCPHCQKGFANNTNLTRHIQRIHDKVVVTANYVTCNVCQKLVQVKSLKRHLKNVHDQE